MLPDTPALPPPAPCAPVLDGRSERIERGLAEYGARTRRALLAYLPEREPRRYLYDLVAEYPLRPGKMLRSALCLATCRAFGGSLEDALDTAVAIELLHNAFLIHDDIQDGSPRRRGRPALHVEHGLPLALNTGDALSALSLRPLLRNVEVLGAIVGLQILTETQHVVEQTVEGQALELGWRRDNRWDMTAEDYLRMALQKTCWYSAIHPCRTGAMIGLRVALAPSYFVPFGLFLGAAFQIQDDVLNVTGADGQYGKVTGDDILEGKRTLLLIHLMEQLDCADQRRLHEILALTREQRAPEHVQWVVAQMHARGSVEFARSYARGLAGAALYEFEQTYGELPDSEDKRFIQELVLFMIERAA